MVYANVDQVHPEISPSESEYSMDLMNETKKTVEEVAESITVTADEVTKSLENIGAKSAEMFVNNRDKEEIFAYLDKNQEVLLEYLEKRESLLMNKLNDLEDRVQHYAERSVASMLIEDIKGVISSAQHSINVMKKSVKEFFAQAKETVMDSIDQVKGEIAQKFAQFASKTNEKIDHFVDKATENIEIVTLGIVKSVRTTSEAFHNKVRDIRQEHLNAEVKTLEENYAKMRQELEKYAKDKGLDFPSISAENSNDKEEETEAEFDFD